MESAVNYLSDFPQSELIWASPREILNFFQADRIGCPIITLAHSLVEKLALFHKDLDAFSLETVRMFHEDALRAGYRV